MSDFLYCILVYAFCAIVLILFQTLNWKLSPVKRSKTLAIRGLSLIWANFFLNIFYTGLMGWNRQPESSLEWWLDILTFGLIFIGFVAFYVGNNKPRGRRVSVPKM